jgi:uncharacterized membrane protein YGL010W
VNTRTNSGADVYDATHRHPVNRALHALGIPVVACSGIAAVLGPRIVGAPRGAALAGVGAGLLLLFLGHAIEGTRPAFFSTREVAALHAVQWWRRGAVELCKRVLSR